MLRVMANVLSWHLWVTLPIWQLSAVVRVTHTLGCTAYVMTRSIVGISFGNILTTTLPTPDPVPRGHSNPPEVDGDDVGTSETKGDGVAAVVLPARGDGGF